MVQFCTPFGIIPDITKLHNYITSRRKARWHLLATDNFIFFFYIGM